MAPYGIPDGIRRKISITIGLKGSITDEKHLPRPQSDHTNINEKNSKCKYKNLRLTECNQKQIEGYQMQYLLKSDSKKSRVFYRIFPHHAAFYPPSPCFFARWD